MIPIVLLHVVDLEIRQKMRAHFTETSTLFFNVGTQVTPRVDNKSTLEETMR